MNIKNRIGLQSCKHNNLLLEEEIEFTIKHGFSVFEIFFDSFLPWDIKKEMRKEIYDFSQKNNLTLQVHSPIERIRNWKDILIESINFTAEIGGHILTVHPSEKDLTFYEELLCLSVKKNVYIAFENYKESGTYYTPENMINILNKFPEYRNRGITFDTGHSNIHSEPVNYLKNLPHDKLLNIHIHDNMGEIDNHLPLGQGNINFRELIKYLKSIDYKGNFIIEHWHENLKSAIYFINLWSEIF